MLSKLKKQLGSAEGRSEFVIVVVCDIRGFSSFSTIHESPDTAMFIKRFYLQLLNNYFGQAVFAKPTGDGLVMAFRYSENSLAAVSESVISSCFAVVKGFPTMFGGDPMINFETPEHIGFGISRGTACCLYSGRQIIDYSGQLLNLASRLNDLARPRGIVIDGGYLMEVIPEAFRGRFVTQNVYVRGICEEKPRQVFCSEEVQTPSYALFPIAADMWESVEKSITVKNLSKIEGGYNIPLPKEVQSPTKIKVELIWPHPKLKGLSTWRTCDTAKYYKDATGPNVSISASEAMKIATGEKLRPSTTLSLRVQYVPKVPAAGKDAATEPKPVS